MFAAAVKRTWGDIYLFFEIEYSKLINCLGGMCQTCQGITIYGMFGI
jgi:hypothetical protein